MLQQTGPFYQNVIVATLCGPLVLGGWFPWGISSQIWTRASLSINSLIIQELPAYYSHKELGIVVYQEEPWSHCTSEGSGKTIDPRISS